MIKKLLGGTGILELRVKNHVGVHHLALKLKIPDNFARFDVLGASKAFCN